jgi:hypothetical protein
LAVLGVVLTVLVVLWSWAGWCSRSLTGLSALLLQRPQAALDSGLPVEDREQAKSIGTPSGLRGVLGISEIVFIALWSMGR